MSKIGDFLFNNSYYNAVMHSYSEATRRYNNGLEVWRTMHPLVGKDYHSKEVIHKNINDIEEVSGWVAATNKLLRQCKKAVKVFFYERGLELPQQLQYDEYKLIAENTETIEETSRWITTTNRLLSEYNEAVEIFLLNNGININQTLRADEYKLIAENAETIKKASRWITTTNRLLSEYNEVVKIFCRDKRIRLNQTLRFDKYKLIANEEYTIKRMNEKLCELRHFRSNYPKAYDLLVNRIPDQISFEELYQFDVSYLKSKTEFLHFYEENDKLCHLVLGESQHAIDSFSQDVIKAENFCLWYINNLYKPQPGPVSIMATVDSDRFKLKMEALLEGDELKGTILDSYYYGGKVKFSDTFTISDFYNLRECVDKLGLTFDDLLRKVEENQDSIKAFNKEQSSKRVIYIEDYVRASTKGTALFNYIEQYKDQQSARTKAKQIKDNYPLGFAAIYGNTNDLGSCDFSLITNIIENEEIIVSEENKEQEKERQRRMKEEEVERRRREEHLKREEEERIARELDALRRCVSSWTHPNNAYLPCFSLYYYYPTKYEEYVDEDVWRIRKLVWNFKAKPHREQAENVTRGLHEAAVAVVIPLFKRVLTKYFGNDVSKLTLCCIPASTKSVTEKRYKDFSEKLCSALGMTNGYDYVWVSKEGEAKSAGGTIPAEFSINTDFFRDKYVILFDDIITSGRSMEKFKRMLEGVGAKVIAGLSIGKTAHHWHDRHPIDGL